MILWIICIASEILIFLSSFSQIMGGQYLIDMLEYYLNLLKLNMQTPGNMGLPWIWLLSVMCQEILCDAFLNNDKGNKLKLILFSWLTSWQHAYTLEVKDVGKTSIHWGRNWIERLGREELTNTSERFFDSNGSIKGWIGP